METKMLGTKRIRRWIPVCVCAYQATVIDNAKSIGCIWWHNIHHPNWVIIQCSSKSSKLCVHIHNITDGIGLQLWHQLLVVIDPLNPQLCVSSEHLRAGVLNELQSFRWSGESFRPSGSLSNTKLFHTFLLRYNTGSHGHIPEVNKSIIISFSIQGGGQVLVWDPGRHLWCRHFYSATKTKVMKLKFTSILHTRQHQAQWHHHRLVGKSQACAPHSRSCHTAFARQQNPPSWHISCSTC